LEYHLRWAARRSDGHEVIGIIDCDRLPLATRGYDRAAKAIEYATGVSASPPPCLASPRLRYTRVRTPVLAYWAGASFA
jgi:hypothetical protein